MVAARREGLLDIFQIFVCCIFVDIDRAVLIDACEHIIMIDAPLEGLETGLTWETGTHIVIRLARRGLGIRRIFDEFELI